MPELYRAAAARADCHFALLLTKCHLLAATWPLGPWVLVEVGKPSGPCTKPGLRGLVRTVQWRQDCPWGLVGGKSNRHNHPLLGAALLCVGLVLQPISYWTCHNKHCILRMQPQPNPAVE